MKKFINKILDLIYPKGLTCNNCGKELNDTQREYCWCEECQNKLIIIDKSIKLVDNTIVASSFYYNDIIRSLILRYKDSNQPYLAEYMAKYMAKEYREQGFNCDGLAYVPSNRASISKRGYDALGYVAKFLAKELDLPILTGLQKKDGIKDLASLEVSKRESAIADAFYVEDRNIEYLKKRVLLIDDVITTGSTIQECVKAIMQSGSESVSVLTLASAQK